MPKTINFCGTIPLKQLQTWASLGEVHAVKKKPTETFEFVDFIKTAKFSLIVNDPNFCFLTVQ